ncbi:MAG: hypothetical protein HYZ16_05905 [Bacteroidetes bacterium]|nr:hypothetical protein [Bacteroidota bacterium]
MDIEKILDNNLSWVAQKKAGNPSFFSELAEGQKPEILYMGCSDSRVRAEDLMGLGPEGLFVHRNLANQVISTDNHVNAAVQRTLHVNGRAMLSKTRAHQISIKEHIL